MGEAEFHTISVRLIGKVRQRSACAAGGGGAGKTVRAAKPTTCPNHAMFYRFCHSTPGTLVLRDGYSLFRSLNSPANVILVLSGNCFSIRWAMPQMQFSIDGSSALWRAAQFSAQIAKIRNSCQFTETLTCSLLEQGECVVPHEGHCDNPSNDSISQPQSVQNPSLISTPIFARCGRTMCYTARHISRRPIAICKLQMNRSSFQSFRDAIPQSHHSILSRPVIEPFQRFRHGERRFQQVHSAPIPVSNILVIFNRMGGKH